MSMFSDNTILVGFLDAVPYPLTFALVELAPFISSIRYVAELFSWRLSWYHSSLLLVSWWALCILIEPSLRYFLLPIFLLFWILLRPTTMRPVIPVTTEQSLQTTITDLLTIQSLLPSLSPAAMPASVALRVLCILYVPYLILTYSLHLRILFAVVGTVLLSWRAPWAVVLRATMGRSAWIRWSSYHLWSSLTGQPLAVRVPSMQPSAVSPKPVQALRFLFTIYENQRWWMGLDWTAALLPGERPSWCSASQNPVSPPNGFSLPEPSTIYLSNGKGGRVKRTAIWKWEEPEWRVLIGKDGGSLSRVERPLPAGKDDSPSGNRLLKAAAKARDLGTGSGDTETVSADSYAIPQDDVTPTDTDGWVYGDNKWEGPSNKGGMGKYTRYRRWTRIAAVYEIVESVEDGELGIYRGGHSPTDSLVTAVSVESMATKTATEVESSPLRQRLRQALTKASGSSSA